MGRPKPL
jgi:hypothetical protein